MTCQFVWFLQEQEEEPFKVAPEPELTPMIDSQRDLPDTTQSKWQKFKAEKKIEASDRARNGEPA